MERAEAEAIVTLLDSCWFEQLILSKGLRKMPSGSILDRDEDVAAPPSSGLRIEEISRVPSALLRSMSDQLSSQASFLSGSPSPSSVLRSPAAGAHLHPVESGKDISEEALPGFEKHSSLYRNRGRDGERRNKKALSKSLSELEFEELKGFMDLGFVFSEEDKDSSLASIIPGLHKLGKKKDEQQKKHEEDEEAPNEGRQVDWNVKETDHEIASSSPSSMISRPYLSETWEWLDKRKERPLVHWNFPALNNETDMKENLRWWAHTVASNVR